MNELFKISQTGAITLPSYEVLLLVAILCVCLLVQSQRVGLICSFLFSYKWGWQFIKAELAPQSEHVLFVYLGMGVLSIVAIFLGIVRPTRSAKS